MLSRTSQLILRNVIFIFIIAILVGIFFSKNYLAYVLGVSIGSIFTMIKLIWMEKVIDKSLDMNAKQAQIYIFGEYMLRYISSALVIYFIISKKNISFIGFLIGLFSLQVAAYFVGMSKK